MKTPHLVGSAPVLLVRDVVASVAHYRKTLGFDGDGIWGHPPKFAILQRDGLRLMLNEAPAGASLVPHWKIDSGIWNVYFWVDDVDALFAEVSARGATIDYGLSNKVYGVREFGVRDLDDHDIAFGQILS